MDCRAATYDGRVWSSLSVVSLFGVLMIVVAGVCHCVLGLTSSASNDSSAVRSTTLGSSTGNDKPRKRPNLPPPLATPEGAIGNTSSSSSTTMTSVMRSDADGDGCASDAAYEAVLEYAASGVCVGVTSGWLTAGMVFVCVSCGVWAARRFLGGGSEPSATSSEAAEDGRGRDTLTEPERIGTCEVEVDGGMESAKAGAKAEAEAVAGEPMASATGGCNLCCVVDVIVSVFPLVCPAVFG